jgi:pyridoxine 5-phosphate synthase
LGALLAEQAGADNITLHLREDRRHIQDRDIWAVKDVIQIPLNFEMALSDEMLIIAEKLQPWQCCLVPEKREERTTEGGLDVLSHPAVLKSAIQRLQQAGIRVSLFIEANLRHIEAAQQLGADAIEIHTGTYAEQPLGSKAQATWLEAIQQAAELAAHLGLEVHAGHGLHYHNVQAVSAILAITTLNIGHAIVAQAVFVGFKEAVREMKRQM